MNRRMEDAGPVVRTVPLTNEQYTQLRNGLMFGSRVVGAVYEILEAAIEQRMLREESAWEQVKCIAPIDSDLETVTIDWVIRAVVVRAKVKP